MTGVEKKHQKKPNQAASSKLLLTSHNVLEDKKKQFEGKMVLSLATSVR